MPNLKMVAPVLLLLALTSCAADPEPGTWQRGTAKACDSCTSDLDCAAGLLCDQDSFACKSVEQLKAKAYSEGKTLHCEADCWQACIRSGYCHIKDGVCRPESDADCASSEKCVQSKTQCKYFVTADGSKASCVD